MKSAGVYFSKLSSKGQVTIPLKVRESLKLQQNDIIRFQLTPEGEFLINRYETTINCYHNTLEPCVLCLNSGIIDFTKPFFQHLNDVQRSYNFEIIIQIIEHGIFSIQCAEKILTETEQTILQQWYEHQEQRRKL